MRLQVGKVYQTYKETNTDMPKVNHKIKTQIHKYKLIPRSQYRKYFV